MSDPTHYDTLGVSRNAPTSIIRAAYRAWMKEVHPDTGSQADSDRASAINEAFRVLSKPAERERYDALLATEAPPGVRPLEEEDSDVDWGSEEEIHTSTPPPAAARYGEDDFGERDPSSISGFNVFDRARIDLSRMEWYTRDYGNVVVPARRWRVPSKRARRSLAWALFAVLVLSFVAPIVGLAVDSSALGAKLSSLISYILILPAIFFVCGYPRSRGNRGTFRYVTLLALGAIVVAVGFGESWLVGAIWLVWLLAYVTMVELFRSTSSVTSTRRMPLIPKGDVEKFTTWGEATGDLTSATRGDRAFGGHTSGRIMTGQLLNELTRIPGARVVHLSRAGVGHEVDHVILCGDRLAVVQSLLWRSGDYYWLGPTLVCARPGERHEGIPTAFPAAVETYRTAFSKLETRGWMVLHSSDHATIRVNNRDAADKPRLSTPESFLQEVGGWLAEGKTTGAVHRKFLSKLVFGWN